MYNLKAIGKVFGILDFMVKFKVREGEASMSSNGLILVHQHIVTFCDKFAPKE